ncbi:MAG: hypothetical protein F6K00_30210 [Leptolyngbya sp. SIOISBB]|nr:hypothetical protein [Leptolyngbya sp. SIOISBB]
MFNSLSNFFDRAFAVGHFLPAVIFVNLSIWTADSFGISRQGSQVQFSTLVDATIIGVISWLLGTLLAAINRDILRVMEGYGSLNPARLLYTFQIRKYRNKKRLINDLNNKYLNYYEHGEAFPESDQKKRNKLLREFVNSFPDEERWLLPTSFGNAMRAFEVYPRLMYGIDAIPGWERLLSVIPEGYKRLIDSSKSQLDFWINIWFLNLILLGEYCFLFLYTRNTELIWLPFLVFVLAFYFFSKSRSAAIEWGILIKSSFDLFLDDLRKKLGFAQPASFEEEVEMWRKYSQSIIFHYPDSLPTKYVGRQS